MSLLEMARPYFAPESQRRGREYARLGSVHVTATATNSIGASVGGRNDYRVWVYFDGRAFRVSCSCPHARTRKDPCKHIWATIVVGTQRGVFQEPSDEDGIDAGWAESDMLADERANATADTADTPDTGDPDDIDGLGERTRPGGHDRYGAAPHRQRHWRALISSAITRPPSSSRTRSALQGDDQLLYVVDADETLGRGCLVVEVQRRRRTANGKWGKPRAVRISADEIDSLHDPDDRRILAAFVGAREDDMWSRRYVYGDDRLTSKLELSRVLSSTLIPTMCESGRCRLRLLPTEKDPATLMWEESDPWELWIAVTRAEGAGDDSRPTDYVLTGSLRRGSERLSLDGAELLAPGLIFRDKTAAPLADADAFAWVDILLRERSIRVPESDGESLVAQVLGSSRRPRLDLPPELRFDEVRVSPRPRLVVRSKTARSRTDWLAATLSFDYDGMVVGNGLGRPTGDDDAILDLVDVASRRVLVRDSDAERQAIQTLYDLPFRRRRPDPYSDAPQDFELRNRDLPGVVRALLSVGWMVEASGQRLRSPGPIQLGITSGIDWFELRGDVDFDGQSASFPELLAAYQRGENTVVLGDGSVGLLPEEWLRRHAVLANLGTMDGDHVRFQSSQAALLDALLAAQPETSVDAGFDRVRQSLASFTRIEPMDAPAGFQGTLRDYQRDGLGWMRFLAEFGLGGCLADDMGLGKTIQVLALLECRRSERRGQKRKPSLVVVPRSLIFNWVTEASRFTPRLEVLDHTGASRARTTEGLENCDVVLTTYGTLRRDVTRLMEVAFDYVILDEAQAIKNASTASAKAARLLKSDHRLALSGTPIENHLGEIWSLFEFLNPGILGSASAFRTLQLEGAADAGGREVIAQALRPFILRRTKGQVASELPAKSEQSLLCELPPKQRKLYDDLRNHYRAALDKRITSQGLGRSKILVLEALLRLRQAACHPGLIDREKIDLPSAKVDLLLEQLASVVDEGHKALVFSQFTSLLAIVRSRLDNEGVEYAYLDGRTRARDRQVDRFQNDPDCMLFLISLKAGGLGLNLTAAEYVYLLDPWWNPAVEAQAIDRTHRIGQTRQVFAYRLVAKDTVEEKILELQKTKRDLADSIIKADNTLVRDLGREDLELLLS